MVFKVKDFSIKLSFFLFCRVCGDNVLGFYYGVNMCEVCKVSVGCREWLYIYIYENEKFKWFFFKWFY